MIHRPRTRHLKNLSLKPRIPMIRRRRRRSNPIRGHRWCHPNSPSLGTQPDRRAAVALPSEGRRVLGAKRPTCCRAHRSVLPCLGRRVRSLRWQSPHPVRTTRCPGIGRLQGLSLKRLPKMTERHLPGRHLLGLHRRETCSGLNLDRPAVHLRGLEPPLSPPQRTLQSRIGMPARRRWLPPIPARAPPQSQALGVGRTVSVSPKGSAVTGIGRSCNR